MRFNSFLHHSRALSIMFLAGRVGNKGSAVSKSLAVVGRMSSDSSVRLGAPG